MKLKNSAIYLLFHLKYSLVNPCDFSPGELFGNTSVRLKFMLLTLRLTLTDLSV